MCVPKVARLLAERQADVGQDKEVALELRGTTLALDPEELAVLALAVCLRVEAEATEAGYTGKPVRTVCLELAQALVIEVQYRRWQGGADKSVAAAVARRYPAMDARTWRRLRKRLEDVDPLSWSPAERLQIGAALLEAVTTACPEHFVTSTRNAGGGRTETVLGLGEEARRLLDDRTARAEVARPLLMPMLIQPIDWRYE